MVQVLNAPARRAGCIRFVPGARLVTRPMWGRDTHRPRVAYRVDAALETYRPTHPPPRADAHACAHRARPVRWLAARRRGTPAFPPAADAIRAGSPMPRGQGRIQQGRMGHWPPPLSGRGQPDRRPRAKVAVGRPARRRGQRSAGRVRLGAVTSNPEGPPGEQPVWRRRDLKGASRENVGTRARHTQAPRLVRQPQCHDNAER